jgi:hypothetical protein
VRVLSLSLSRARALSPFSKTVAGSFGEIRGLATAGAFDVWPVVATNPGKGKCWNFNGEGIRSGKG